MSEQYGKEYFIPANFKTGISFMGKAFSLDAVLEAAILALIPIGVIFFILPNAGITMSWSTSSTLVTFLSVSLGYLGIHGINGYTVSQFIKSLLRYRKNKRVCYFNPRIKTEASPYSTSNIAAQMLPREKLQEFYQKAKKSYEARQRKTAVNEQKEILSDREHMFFSDDLGVVATPVEYMDKKEFKAYRKQQKKEARKKQKEERAIRRMQKQTAMKPLDLKLFGLIKRKGGTEKDGKKKKTLVQTNNNWQKKKRAADRQKERAEEKAD